MSRTQPVIAVDVMGGDFGPSVLIPGALEAARRHQLYLLLVGQEDKIKQELERHSTQGVGFEIRHASQVVESEEKPSDVLRKKKDSSIQVACHLVKSGEADGLVSAGHSGASVACGMFILGRIPGVERPALATIMPTENRPAIIVDVGANVDCRPHHLFQFGLMADAYSRAFLNTKSPSIGLLSIGEEEGKGNMLVKEAYEMFKMAHCVNFVGNIEGRDLFTGEVDIVVCDGFVGNVVLKLSEGLSGSFSRILKKELLHSTLAAKIGTFLAKGAFKRFAKFVDYAEYGGAALLGLEGVFVVSHGKSNQLAIQNAVKMAGTLVQQEANKHLTANITANEELTLFGKAVK